METAFFWRASRAFLRFSVISEPPRTIFPASVST